LQADGQADHSNWLEKYQKKEKEKEIYNVAKIRSYVYLLSLSDGEL